MKIVMVGRPQHIATRSPQPWISRTVHRAAPRGPRIGRLGRSDRRCRRSGLDAFPAQWSAPAFRLLHVPGAGLDGIDFAALPAGATVCNVFEHEIPMAEYALACMLEHQVELAALRARFSTEQWTHAYLKRQPRGELFGKTVVIVGFGRIATPLPAEPRHSACRSSPFPHAPKLDEWTARWMKRTHPLNLTRCCPVQISSS